MLVIRRVQNIAPIPITTCTTWIVQCQLPTSSSFWTRPSVRIARPPDHSDRNPHLRRSETRGDRGYSPEGDDERDTEHIVDQPQAVSIPSPDQNAKSQKHRARTEEDGSGKPQGLTCAVASRSRHRSRHPLCTTAQQTSHVVTSKRFVDLFAYAAAVARAAAASSRPQVRARARSPSASGPPVPRTMKLCLLTRE